MSWFVERQADMTWQRKVMGSSSRVNLTDLCWDSNWHSSCCLGFLAIYYWFIGYKFSHAQLVRQSALITLDFEWPGFEPWGFRTLSTVQLRYCAVCKNDNANTPVAFPQMLIENDTQLVIKHHTLRDYYCSDCSLSHTHTHWLHTLKKTTVHSNNTQAHARARTHTRTHHF